MKGSKNLIIKGLELDILELEKILDDKIEKIYILKLEMGAIEERLKTLKRELGSIKK